MICLFGDNKVNDSVRRCVGVGGGVFIYVSVLNCCTLTTTSRGLNTDIVGLLIFDLLLERVGNGRY